MVLAREVGDIERVITVMTKRLLLVGGVLAALAVPAGVAVAATTTPSPSPKAPATTQPYGPGSGRMMGGTGDPRDCPYHNSPEMQKWREQRAERQQLAPADRLKLMEQMRDRMWSQRTGTTASS